MVFQDGGYGHVEYVTAVNGSKITVNGGGYYNLDHTPHKMAGQDPGIWTGYTKSGVVGSNDYGKTLVGYIYFGTSPQVTASFTTNTSKQSIGETNAVLAMQLRVSGASISDVTEVGFFLYDEAGAPLTNKAELISVQASYMEIWYDIQGETGYKLVPGRTYQYLFYAFIHGKAYYSEKLTFKTPGSSVSAVWTTDSELQNIKETNAVLAKQLRLNGAPMTAVTQVGFVLYDSAGKQLITKSDKTTISDSYMKVWYDIQGETGYSLTPGTAYQYRFYAVIYGTTHYSDTESFTTTGSYSVFLNPAGGTVNPTSLSVKNGGTYQTLPVPVKDGYTFNGWYTAASGGTQVTASSTVSLNANQTLYAQWSKIPVEEPLPDIQEPEEVPDIQEPEPEEIPDVQEPVEDPNPDVEAPEEELLPEIPDVEQVPEFHFPRVSTCTQGQFTDVYTNQWFTSSVANAVELGLMKGNSAVTFNPYGDVTIAEAVTMAARIHSIYTNGSENFVQAQGKAWYQVYLDYAYRNGIIDSAVYSADVKQKATRAQYAEIFANALPEDGLYEKNNVGDYAIPDVKLSDSYGEAVYKLYRAGIFAGSDIKGTFSPMSYITRAESAAVVARMADTDNRMDFSL